MASLVGISAATVTLKSSTQVVVAKASNWQSVSFHDFDESLPVKSRSLETAIAFVVDVVGVSSAWSSERKASVAKAKVVAIERY